MRVLVVEDDVSSRSLLVNILQNEGYEVQACANGAEAWATLQIPDSPLLVLLDWCMPEMDGLEVVTRLRALRSEHPHYILMLTSRVEKSDVIAGLEAGANDYLTKPYDIGELRARLATGQRMIEIQSSLIASRDVMAELATHDTLTGLLNRSGIIERLRQELSRGKRYHSNLAVGMCDIDHFKQVNDLHGHQTGDAVLRAFARVLSDNLRPYDAVGRIGGEEFLITAPIQEKFNIVPVFSRLCEQIAGHKIETESGIISVTISIGVVNTDPEMTIEKILAAADSAMYEAKRAGRNRVVYSQ